LLVQSVALHLYLSLAYFVDQLAQTAFQTVWWHPPTALPLDPPASTVALVANHLTTVVGTDLTHLHLHTAGARTHHPEGTVLVASILSSDHNTALTEAVDISTVVLHIHAFLRVGVHLEELITVTGTDHLVVTTADQCTDKGLHPTTEDLLLTAAITPQRWCLLRSVNFMTSSHLIRCCSSWVCTKDHLVKALLLLMARGTVDPTMALLPHTITQTGQGVTTMALLTHAITTQLDQDIMSADQDIMSAAQVITGAEHPTTGMAATLHHAMAATHPTDVGLHPTFEWCLGHSHASQVSLY